MSYQKFKPDLLFNGKAFVQGDVVLITDTGGMVKDIVPLSDAGEGIQYLQGLITPGFINSHCHLELSHLKDAIPEKTGLPVFVQNVMANRMADQELKTAAMINAEQEMYQNGIVAVGDICNTADSFTIKHTSKIKWHNFIEVSGFVDATAEKRLAEMKNIYDAFSAGSEKTQRISFSPHAPYSVSKTLFQLLNIETSSRVTTIHNQEASAENELYKNKTGDFLELYKNLGIDIGGFEPSGNTSFQSWLPFFNSRQSIIAVHNTFTNEADLNFYKALQTKQVHAVYFCLCCNANIFIEQTTPSVDLFQRNDCDIVIGTDSYASNRQLNILEEIKTIRNKSQQFIPLKEVLKWATLNGAIALKMEDELGSFEIGKKPGVVFIDNISNNDISPNSGAKRLL